VSQKKNEFLVYEGEMLEEIIFLNDGKISLNAAINSENPMNSINKYFYESFSPFTTEEERKIMNENMNTKSHFSAIGEMNFDRAKLKLNNAFKNYRNDKDEKSQFEIHTNFQKSENFDFDIKGGAIINDEGDYQYLKILDIRKNEHFGCVFMTLNRPCPLSLQVKSKIAELFLLKKEQAVNISKNYPNISNYFSKIKKDNIYAHLIILGNNAEIHNETDTEITYKISQGNNIWIHRIESDDMQRIMKITNDAKYLLKQNGSLQWQQGYPNEETFISDINNKSLYGIYENNNLMAYGAYILGKDINYVEIDGKWDVPANEKDLAIHRVAVDSNCHGKKYGVKILKYGIIYAKKLRCISVKVDTHKNNIPMQKCINNSGFVYKGVVKIIRDK
jgi:GNAT superfamily N-acetyltransferase